MEGCRCGTFTGFRVRVEFSRMKNFCSERENRRVKCRYRNRMVCEAAMSSIQPALFNCGF